MTLEFSAWVLTAERAAPKLEQTLASLREGGIYRYSVFEDTRRRGCWQAWLAMVGRFVEDRPTSRWLLACEDDIEVSRGLADYLNRLIPSLDAAAVYSLYSTADSRSSSLMEFSPVPPRLAQGSCCYLIEWATLRRIVESPSFPERRDGTDYNLGTWCRDSSIPYMVHSPSLVLHTGAVSSLAGGAGGRPELRQCHCFVREIVLDDSEVPELADATVPLVDSLLPRVGLLPAGWRARVDPSGGRGPHDPYSISVFARGAAW